MKVATTAEVQAHFDDYLKASAREPVILTRNGKLVAVLDGTLNEDDLERLRLVSNPKFRKMMAAAKRRFREGKGIPHDEFWRRIEQKHPDTFTKSGRLKKRGARPANSKPANTTALRRES